jgi:hypothetical protein
MSKADWPAPDQSDELSQQRIRTIGQKLVNQILACAHSPMFSLLNAENRRSPVFSYQKLFEKLVSAAPLGLKCETHKIFET